MSSLTAQGVTQHRKGKYQLTTPAFDERQPVEKPSFTLDDVKNAIPAHCFERPFLKSFSYLLRDIIFCTTFFLLSLFIQQFALKAAYIVSNVMGFDVTPLNVILETSHLKNVANPASLTQFGIPSSFTDLFGEAALSFFSQPITQTFTYGSVFIYNFSITSLWIAYFILQGAFMTGMWVIGHECGHRGFHANPFVSDAVGIIVHSFLLVPYHAWRISHRTHHSYNADLERDTVHNPSHINALLPSAAHGYLHNDKWNIEKNAKSKKELEPTFVHKTSILVSELHHLLRDVNVFYRNVSYFLYATLGWILYLFMNVLGRRYPNYKSSIPPNHFLPSSPLFQPNEAMLVILSDIVIGCYLYVFYLISSTYGFTFFAMHYITVYMVTNFWLVFITALQHAHPGLPRYTTESWNYLQGALATVDRDYGAFWNYAFHNINDTHVTHHLFSYLPHYNAMEATNAIRPLLGKYYVKTTAESKPFGILKELSFFFKYLNLVAEDDHPALALAEAAINAEKSNKDPVAAVEAVKDEALAKAPHVNGRDVSKEIYWFRTVNY